MAIKLYSGVEHKLDHTPGSAVTAGDLVSIGDFKCYANVDIAASEVGSISFPSGTATVEVTNGNSLAGSAGDPIDYDGTNGLQGPGFGIAAEDYVAGDAFIKVVHSGGGGAGGVVAQTILFTENATNTVHTGTVEIPAGSTLLNIQVVNTVLWTATSASFEVGDDDDPDGWFTSVDCKATDLLVGEVLDISNAENWGGVQGAYCVAATGRKGRTTAGVDSGVYYGAASEVIGVMTVGTPATTDGRTYMTVTYVNGSVVDAVGTTP